MKTSGYPNVDRALLAYFKKASTYPGYPYKTFDEIIDRFALPGTVFPKSFSDALNIAKLPEDRVKLAMEAMAADNKTSVKWITQDVFNYLKKDVQSLTRAISATAKDIAVSTAQTGQSLVKAAANVVSIAPYLYVGVSLIGLLLIMRNVGAKSPKKETA